MSKILIPDLHAKHRCPKQAILEEFVYFLKKLRDIHTKLETVLGQPLLLKQMNAILSEMKRHYELTEVKFND